MKLQAKPETDSDSPEISSQETSSAAVSAARFDEGRLLGRGGMGAVYLVRDRETGEYLALKKLLRLDAKSVLRLKREFRSLANVGHRNLVKLYELGREGDVWFLTMEYVPGVELTTYLGAGYDQTHDPDAAMGGGGSRSRETGERALFERIASTFHQLASGVHALHCARVLHRDLKPSNVLVAEGRVVVLDFGLARRLDEHAADVTEEGNIAGTPGYMAPEQLTGNPLTEASDWYAFGAMLYQALTGGLPHDGTLQQILTQKLELDPLPPVALAAGVPSTLNALCLALLSRNPQERPLGIEVMSRLESFLRDEGPSPLTQELRSTLFSEQQLPANSNVAALWGRDDDLAALHAGREQSVSSRTLLMHIRGASGAGKTALIETFLDQVERGAAPIGLPTTLILRSRCYEREAMPFKALDGMMDALSRYLLKLEHVEVGHLLPKNVAALTKLFPVLERLHAVQRLLAMRSASGDAVNDRQRAESALYELLARLASRGPLVLWIDDLQWGDLDSAAILKRWLQQTSDLPILVIFSYRADEVDTSECLRLLLDTHTPLAADVVTLDIRPLAPTDVIEICRQRLPHMQANDPILARIVDEAAGSPFLAGQLASLAQAKLLRGASDSIVCSIGGLIAETNALLTPDARKLLTVLALAGRPIHPRLALRATQLRKGGRDVFHELRRLQLVRTRDMAGERLIEVYHDRIRQSVQETLDPAESQEVYGALLAAVSFSGRADPDWLHVLALGAHEFGAALRHGLNAAERATKALAFERAAELYKTCLSLTGADPKERVALLVKRGAVLGLCGQGEQAAEVYLEAIALADEQEALQLMRFATSHLLRSGRFEEGEAMLQRVLSHLNERLPSTPGGLMRAIGWEKLRLTLRGMSFTLRREDEVPAAQLARFDTYDALRLDSMSIDPMRAYLFQLRLTRWALDAGEPMRVLRVLGANCYTEASSGTERASKRADELLRQMEQLAKSIGTPEARIDECVIRALSCWMLGRSEEVLAPSLEAEQILSKLVPRGNGADYILRRATSSARIGALFELGRYGEFITDLQEELQRVRAIGHRAAVLQLTLNEVLLDVLLDRPQQVVERLELQRGQLPPVEFSVYHILHMMAVCIGGVFSGDLSWAMRLHAEDWPRFTRSPLRHAINLAIHARHSRLHLLVTNHVLGSSASDVPSSIKAELRAVKAYGARGKVVALQQQARLAFAAGDRQRATELMSNAIARNVGGGYIERMRYGLGLMTGGAEGAAICEQSERALKATGLIQIHGCVRGDYPELCGGAKWR